MALKYDTNKKNILIACCGSVATIKLSELVHQLNSNPHIPVQVRLQLSKSLKMVIHVSSFSDKSHYDEPSHTFL